MSVEPVICVSCGKESFYRRKECAKCEGDRNRRKVDALAAVIRELKSGAKTPLAPEREAELIGLLYVYEHPDPDGLTHAVKLARQSPPPKKGWN